MGSKLIILAFAFSIISTLRGKDIIPKEGNYFIKFFTINLIYQTDSHYFYLIQIELSQTQMIGVTRLWVDFVPLLANFHGFLDYGGKMQ